MQHTRLPRLPPLESSSSMFVRNLNIRSSGVISPQQTVTGLSQYYWDGTWTLGCSKVFCLLLWVRLGQAPLGFCKQLLGAGFAAEC